VTSIPPEDKPRVSGQERRTNLALRQHHDGIQKALQEPTPQDEHLKVLIEAVRPADLAELLARMSDDDQLRILRVIDLRRGAVMLKRSRAAAAASWLARVERPRAADFLDFLPIDDRASILEAMEEDVRAELLREMESHTAAEVRGALAWPRRTAGRLLQTHVVKVSPEMTVGQTLHRIREVNEQMEKINDIYVIDPKGRLVGMASLRDLVVSPPDKPMSERMTRDVVSAKPTDDQEVVARLIGKYDFLSIPILDAGGVFLGIVTVDDVVDVLQAEQTEDMLNQAGIAGTDIADEPYLNVKVPTIVRTRVWWLLMLFVAETLTGTVLRHFEDELAKVVALSFFIPLLIGTGGNAGSQTVSSIIRALALGEIEPRDVWRVLRREATAGLVLGLLLGGVAFVRAVMWGTTMQVSIAVAISIIAICTWANTVAAVVPLAAQRIGFDPTVMSAPFITTLVDATGLFIYFSIAGIILRL
jgi:magnesium transporter